MKTIINNEIKDISYNIEDNFIGKLTIYEVIRVINGKALFIEDNIKRLKDSIYKSGKNYKAEIIDDIKEKINSFISIMNVSSANIKYALVFDENSVDEYIYTIKHTYPNPDDYINGVPVSSIRYTRENPNIKYANLSLRETTNKIIEKNNVYEVILINKDNFMTEGSRSNLFFIKNDELFTAPVKYVLPGTSRKRVFNMCTKNNIELKEKLISYDDISMFDSAFITGTSPLLLPISNIDGIKMKTNTNLLQKLINLYFEQVGIK